MNRKTREKLKQQDPILFHVERLSHDGRGVSHYGSAAGHSPDKEGKKIFITFALPDEHVTAKVYESRKKFEESDMVDVVTPSPLRVTPPCPHFTVCGGCSMQHMAPSAQIAFKQGVLAEHFAHFGQLQPKEWLTPLVSNKTDYRTKARLGVRFVHKKDKLLIGFRERKSNFLADIDECKVLDARVGTRIMELKTVFEGLQQREHIPQLEIAVGEDTLAIIVRHLQPLPEDDVTRLLQYFMPLGWHVYLQPEGYDSMHRIDDPDGAMRLHYSLPEWNVRYAFSPLDFTQVNPDMNRKMVQLAIELLQLQAGETVLDLFCGLGNFSLPMARAVGETGYVVAVEGSQDMVERGYENARLNRIEHIEFHAQDLTQDFSQEPWAKRQFDAILIDPPRSGAEQVMQYIEHFQAQRIVYVSCNPATLARDAGLLVQKGYELHKAGVMDMFTHTGHVESIALFVKKDNLL